MNDHLNYADGRAKKHCDQSCQQNGSIADILIFRFILPTTLFLLAQKKRRPLHLFGQTPSATGALLLLTESRTPEGEKSNINFARFRSCKSKLNNLMMSTKLDDSKRKGADVPLWTMRRPMAYRLVKRVMGRAGIVGKQATGKGLLHSFSVAMVTARKPLAIYILAQLKGHTEVKRRKSIFRWLERKSDKW